MGVRPDIFLYDSLGQLAAVVEVRLGRQPTPQWAAEFRRNILSHGPYPGAPFSLFVTPEHIYVWKDVPPAPEVVLPDHDIPAGPILAPYFAKTTAAPADIPRGPFETLVHWWLSDIATWPPAEDDPAYAELRETGFLEAARGGWAKLDLAA